MTKRSLRGALVVAEVLAVCAFVALLPGCASRPTSAPVVDRSPSRAPAPPSPVAQTAPVPGSAVPAPGGTAPSGYYEVKRGDTAYSIALDNGIDHRELAHWNRLEDPSRIQVGQLLRITPPEGEPAVQVGAARGAGSVESRPLESGRDSRPADGAPRPAEGARSPAEGARSPAQDAAAAIRTEPKALRLPYSSENIALLQRGDAAQAAARSAPQAAKPETRPEAAGQPSPSSAQPALSGAKPAAESRETDAIEFIWPARGKLLAGFAEPASKGVDIGGKSGDPVVAAAPGRVIYTGTGIRGYGKLIVIKHDNGFNSVYAHNREILVKQDQTVARGQKIAELGDTDTDTPKLHFEIRKSGKPVDPVKYLPADRPS